MRRRIGLLTGTFDPIHLGHVALARVAMRECGLDEVWFLVNPALGHKVGTTAYEQRWAMVDLALADEADLYVDGLTGGRSHTVAAFMDLMAAWPEDEFVFVVGLEVMERLDEWPEAERVLDRAAFVVAVRPEMGDVVAVMAGLERRLGGAAERLRYRVIELEGQREVSSTVMREAVRRGGEPVGLDERVRRYIEPRGLYRD